MEYSKSKHFNPQSPDEDLVAIRREDEDELRDEVGLIRTISVKVGYNMH